VQKKPDENSRAQGLFQSRNQVGENKNPMRANKKTVLHEDGF